MQISGTRGNEREGIVSDDGLPQTVGTNRQHRGCPDCAGYTPVYFLRTSLTERVVEFLERYPPLYGVG